MKVELIGEGTSPDPEMAIAKAAAECYDSKPSKEIIEHVLKSGHTSVAEHAKFQFRISEVSRVLSHQLVRKRIGFSYSQRSQRYVDEESYDYVLPKSIKETPFIDRYVNIMEDLGDLYSAMVNSDIPKEDARFVLPNAAYTSLYLSANLRSLMDFCEKRMCMRAQWEIRELAYELKERTKEISPMLADFLVPQCVRLGYCPEGKNSCGRYKTRL